uniref:AlNc14C200G8678 protein n=1 Tax=Albugo laibachii Nc14 TaxID=890382 RepID=F0WQK9_9STRA|nr:AlNc14C200G8678 [Albugo laibachii Nc14]CCA24148.1 AlNc14C224G9170 [Albugo laibachii Nc14]|eukprot:CCA24148.1 AlNc14C224G9170 [Albugo laibachii Nc14]
MKDLAIHIDFGSMQGQASKTKNALGSKKQVILARMSNSDICIVIYVHLWRHSPTGHPTPQSEVYRTDWKDVNVIASCCIFVS